MLGLSFSNPCPGQHVVEGVGMLQSSEKEVNATPFINIGSASHTSRLTYESALHDVNAPNAVVSCHLVECSQHGCRAEGLAVQLDWVSLLKLNLNVRGLVRGLGGGGGRGGEGGGWWSRDLLKDLQGEG
jgi:hypothetical protein